MSVFDTELRILSYFFKKNVRGYSNQKQPNTIKRLQKNLSKEQNKIPTAEQKGSATKESLTCLKGKERFQQTANKVREKIFGNHCLHSQLLKIARPDLTGKCINI